VGYGDGVKGEIAFELPWKLKHLLLRQSWASKTVAVMPNGLPNRINEPDYNGYHPTEKNLRLNLGIIRRNHSKIECSLTSVSIDVLLVQL